MSNHHIPVPFNLVPLSEHTVLNHVDIFRLRETNSPNSHLIDVGEELATLYRQKIYMLIDLTDKGVIFTQKENNYQIPGYLHHATAYAHRDRLPSSIQSRVTVLGIEPNRQLNRCIAQTQWGTIYEKSIRDKPFIEFTFSDTMIRALESYVQTYKRQLKANQTPYHRVLRIDRNHPIERITLKELERYVDPSQLATFLDLLGIERLISGSNPPQLRELHDYQLLSRTRVRQKSFSLARKDEIFGLDFRNQTTQTGKITDKAFFLVPFLEPSYHPLLDNTED